MKLKVLLKGLALSVFFLVLTLKGFTQKSYFIYIQADNKQPFYLVMNQKKLNSSPIGYLIVPKLAPDEYKVQLGFPDNQAPEQDFVIKIDKKDAGYALKKFDNGWGLFNFQTMDVIMGVPKEPAVASPAATGVEQPLQNAPAEVSATSTGKKVETAAPRKSAFGDMLSDAMNDPDLASSIVATEAVVAEAAPKPKAPAKGTKQKTPATKHTETAGNKAKADKQAHQPEAVAAAAIPPPVDSTVTAPDVPVNTTAAVNETYDAAGTKGVIKLSEQSDEKGVDLVFLDFNSKSSDTIRLFIPTEISPDSTDTTALAIAKPVEEKKIVEETKVYDPNEKPLAAVSNDSANAGNKADSGAKGLNNPFFDKSAQPSGAAAVAVAGEKATDKKVDSVPDTSTSPSVEETRAPSAMVNNQCTKMATDEDMAKWKKKMISANGDKGMLQAIKKLMSGKCVTTDQVKELGGLFLSDEGRYNFFDEAYLYTYDFGKYPVLENQLFDSYYKKRFKAILRF